MLCQVFGFSLGTTSSELELQVDSSLFGEQLTCALPVDLSAALALGNQLLLGEVAFGGVGLTVLTHNPIFDAIGTIAIGGLLVIVAIILGAETSSLLIGEGATVADAAAIREALAAAPGVNGIIHMKTLYLGPDELMLGAKIAVDAGSSAAEIAKVIDAAEILVRTAVPATRVIYLEPDILRD